MSTTEITLHYNVIWKKCFCNRLKPFDEQISILDLQRKSILIQFWENLAEILLLGMHISDPPLIHILPPQKQISSKMHAMLSMHAID